MKSKYAKFTRWEQYEKRLFQNPKFAEATKIVEPEYQIAKSLIEARHKKGLSQQQLALKIGSKQPVISRLESGTHPPNLSLLTRLATALDTHLTIRFE
jgi:ribosome-binding protein aMBF1 (putative translation factor)